MVNASDCGPEDRGFESHYPPHCLNRLFTYNNVDRRFSLCYEIVKNKNFIKCVTVGVLYLNVYSESQKSMDSFQSIGD